jgi:uncharacterized protein Usg
MINLKQTSALLYRHRKMHIIKRKVITTVDILYWMPDYNNILQRFIWQTMDVRPKYPRVHRFLNYWHHNIDGIISEVKILDSDDTEYKPVKEIING